jgi:uncharacterized protein involved in exopolysaccharide biosynthesis
MNPDNSSIDEDEIDLKEVFRTLNSYRWMIVSFVILFTLGAGIFAYFKPNVYRATSSVEVGIEPGGFAGGQDVLALATESGSMNADTEMEIIKSRFLSEKVLKEVNFSHKYYTTRRLKEVELYKDSPFIVGMNKGYDVSFDFYPVDKKTYRLVVKEAEDENKTVWSYDKVLPYDKEIVTEHFHLNIIKSKDAQDVQYRFVIMDPADVGSYVQKGISVNQTSKKSTILKISYSDNLALRAQEAANSLTRAYIEQSIDKKTKEATRTLAFIDKQLKIITENLKGSAVKLEEFKRTSNTVDLIAKAENIIRHMSEQEAKLAEMGIQEEMLRSLYKQVKAGRNLESITIGG